MKWSLCLLSLLVVFELGHSVLMCYQCSDKDPSKRGSCSNQSGELSWGGCRTYFQPCVTIIEKDGKVGKGCLIEGEEEPAKLENGCYIDSQGRKIIACSDSQCNNKQHKCQRVTKKKLPKNLGVA